MKYSLKVFFALISFNVGINGVLSGQLPGFPNAKEGARASSKSFELRYYQNNPAANGETDFHGETAVFNTEQRIEFLSRYAEYAKDFFDDPQHMHRPFFRRNIFFHAAGK